MTIPRTSACVIALAVMVAVTAQAAEPATLTLACAGTTTTGNAKPVPVSMGIIVNFTARTVQGLDFMTRSIQGLIGPKDFVKITSTNDLTVAFLGSSSGLSINGSLDRVTGELEATYMTSIGEWPQSTITTRTLALKCKPTQRMF